MAITAKDKLREGPRGSSKQKAEFGVEIVQIQFDSSADGTYTVPLPFDTTCAVVGAEAFALTNVVVKADDDAVLTLGRTGAANSFATFTHTAKPGGDFLAKALGAGAAKPFDSAELIDANTDLVLSYVQSSGANANAGAVVVRVMLEAVSGGLFND